LAVFGVLVSVQFFPGTVSPFLNAAFDMQMKVQTGLKIH
jgi:hypothetical protein